MPIPWEGILAVEGEQTGDGRLLDRGAVRWSTGPWPLKWEPTGTHDGPVVGDVAEVWRSGAEIRGRGTLHDDSRDPGVRAAVARIAELAEARLAGLSVGLDDESAELRIKADQVKTWEEWEAAYAADAERIEEEAAAARKTGGRVTVASWSTDDTLLAVTDGRLRHVAVTDQPAIVGTDLSPKALAASSGMIRTPGAALEVPSPDPVTASLRDAAFSNPNFGPDGDSDPRLVFQRRERPEETDGWGCPFTVEDDGRVYGHLATDSRCHGAYSTCVTAPDSGGDFSMFLTGEAVRGVPTGPIILGTTHGVNPDGTVKSYDHLADTGQAVADVTVGRDSHGTWVAGRVRPGITKAQLAALRGSALSGEWLPYGPHLRLRGILAVNSPGYAVQRTPAAVAASGGRVFTASPTCDDCTGRVDLATALRKVRKTSRKRK